MQLRLSSYRHPKHWPRIELARTSDRLHIELAKTSKRICTTTLSWRGSPKRLHFSNSKHPHQSPSIQQSHPNRTIPFAFTGIQRQQRVVLSRPPFIQRGLASILRVPISSLHFHRPIGFGPGFFLALCLRGPHIAARISDW